jgi:hypothetical protein
MFPLVPSHGAAKRIEKVPESVYIITGLKLEPEYCVNLGAF